MSMDPSATTAASSRALRPDTPPAFADTIVISPSSSGNPILVRRPRTIFRRIPPGVIRAPISLAR